MESSSNQRSSSSDSRPDPLTPPTAAELAGARAEVSAPAQQPVAASEPVLVAEPAPAPVPSAPAAQRRSRAASDTVPRPSARRKAADDPRTRSFVRRRRALVVSVVVAAAAIVVTLIVRWSPLFEIHRITASPTEHISSSTISSLAAVPEGSTLFNVDVRGIQERLSANPWVGSVSVGRTLPDQLDIYVVERATAAIVMMSNGTEAWRISDTGYWLEPIALREASSSDEKVPTPVEQARAQASADGVVFATDVAATLRPGAGKACDNDGVNALLAYLSGFGPDLRSRIVTAKASSREALSVTLDNGVEVSLGAPNDIGVKEQVVLNMLREHSDEVTYINVRVTTSPTWRGVTSGDTVAATTDELVVDQRSGDELTVAPVDPVVATSESEGEAADGSEDGASDDGINWDEALVDGGYYDADGDWIWAYYAADGEWIHGYYDYMGEWVQLSDAPGA